MRTHRLGLQLWPIYFKEEAEAEAAEAAAAAAEEAALLEQIRKLQEGGGSSAGVGPERGSSLEREGSRAPRDGFPAPPGDKRKPSATPPGPVGLMAELAAKQKKKQGGE